MKTFEEACREEVKRRFLPHPEDTNFDPAYLVNDIGWFKEGARWASKSPELINEILTKYMEWATNLPAQQFAKWDDEEGDKEKTKVRIRKEFIEFIKREQ